MTVTHPGFSLELCKAILNIIIAAVEPKLSEPVRLLGLIKQSEVHIKQG